MPTRRDVLIALGGAAGAGARPAAAGAIHRVGATAELGHVPAGVRERRLGGRLVMPGLVNCHAHLSTAILRGLYDEMPLDVWFAKGMWPVLNALGPEEGSIGAQLALCELMTTGVTTVVGGDFGTPRRDLLDGVLTAARESRVRGVLSRITVDGADPSPSQFIPANVRERASSVSVREGCEFLLHAASVHRSRACGRAGRRGVRARAAQREARRLRARPHAVALGARVSTSNGAMSHRHRA